MENTFVEQNEGGAATAQPVDLSQITPDNIVIKESKTSEPVSPQSNGQQNPPTAQSQEPAKPQSQADNSNQAQNEPAQNQAPASNSGSNVIEIGDDQIGGLLDEITGGAIASVEQINQILAENRALKELQENPANLFKNQEQKKIYEFLSKYQGADYGQSLQTYAKIQSLDIANLSADDAIREDFILEKGKYGISRSEAERMFDFEVEEKYASKGELAETYKKIDAQQAKQRLEALQKELTTPAPVDEQEQELQQKRQQAQESYVKAVDSVIPNYKILSLTGLTENANEDFHFELEDVKPVENAMRDYQSFFSNRYVTPDGSVNAELLAMDLTRILYQEKIDKHLFDHGTNIGKEMEIARRNNIPVNNGDRASNISGNGKAPANIYDAISNATIKEVR
jgi:hypothetical protein